MEYRLSTTDQGWCDDLLLALRLRDVPGTRIGEVLAEVQSHLAETGEDPREAFGEPGEYADEVAEALGMPVPVTAGGIWRGLIRSLTWRDLATAVVVGLASALLADGLWSLGAGETAAFGQPAGLVTAAAALVLAGYVTWLVRGARREPGDPVVDPRTGEDMARFPRAAMALMVAVPVLSLAGMVFGGYLTRT
ncbi:hypothetical protein [Modestobacter sp. I12A-02662]|uniref:HAAS signaling domain-containing protein n=1 Tax=Modestobacter sp. I12A-02662 TaxID=1730496 RepID=UPI0034DEB2D3